MVPKNRQICIHFSLSYLIWLTAYFDRWYTSVLYLLKSFSGILKTWTEFDRILSLVFKRILPHYRSCIDWHILHMWNFIFFLLKWLIIVVKSCLTSGRSILHFVLMSFSSQTFDTTHSSKLWNPILYLRILRRIYQWSLRYFHVVLLLFIIITRVLHLSWKTFCVIEILS